MNTHVNFEIAKLLKEKGFEGTKSPLWYYKDGTLHKTSTNGYKGLKCWNTWEATQGVRWDAPTVAEVVMWLYEKHGVWISVDMLFEKHQTGFWYCIRQSKEDDIAIQSEEYETSSKALEAAIVYTLEKIV